MGPEQHLVWKDLCHTSEVTCPEPTTLSLGAAGTWPWLVGAWGCLCSALWVVLSQPGVACSHVLADGRPLSGALFSQAWPCELQPLDLPGPLPPALCPQLRAAWALPQFALLCTAWELSRCELERSKGHLVSRLQGSPSSVAPCAVS